MLSELEASKHAILFIDEIHTVIGAGATSGGSLDASNILKPALASGDLRCIGSTTYKEFRNYFEKDRALVRRFQKIDVPEPSEDEAVKILEGLRPSFEAHHSGALHRRCAGRRGQAVDPLHPRPQAARQGDRRDRRGRRGADAAPGPSAQEDHQGQGHRGDRRQDDPRADQDRDGARQGGPAHARRGHQGRRVRPGRGDRGLGVGDQAQPCRPARSRQADRLLPVRRPDRRRQDRGRQAAGQGHGRSS